MTVDECVKQVNATRKAAGDGWWFWSGEVEGKSVRIKGYRTWMQKLQVDGVEHGNSPDKPVRVFLEDLRKAVTS